MDQTMALPLELILNVIECLAPSRHGAILPAENITTRTLLSLCLVSRAILPTATRIFRKHCVYIDSRRRAHLFVQNFLAHDAELAIPLERVPISQIMLAPYAGFPMDWGESDTRPTLRPLTFHEFIASQYDVDTSQLVRSILIGLARSLRSLVIDMELRYMHYDQDTRFIEIRKILREGFESVVHVEEFVSIRDELYLPKVPPTWSIDIEDIIWTCSWKKLRRLCLYNLDVDVHSPFWRAIRQSPCLEQLILVRPEMYIIDGGPDLKRAWIETAYMAGQARVSPDCITVTWINVPEDLPVFTEYATRWQRLDPENHIKVLVANVADPTTDSNVIGITQAFVKEHAVRGTLFDAEALGSEPATSKKPDVLKF